MTNQDDWNNFVDVFREDWDNFEDKHKVNTLIEKDEDIAIVISQLFSEPEQWLRSPNSSLNGKSPMWCMKHGRKEQVKLILMSMPK